MPKKELWQTYSAQGLPVMDGGFPAPPQEGFASPNGVFGIATIWFFRHVDNKLEILWQKRSQFVSHNAGFWDASAGGHINYEESPTVAAVRECREEIGAIIQPEELLFVANVDTGSSLRWDYCVDWTGKDDHFDFSDQEVEEVKWVPFAKFDDFCEKYAKNSIKEDKIRIKTLKRWLELHGHLAK